MSFLLIKKVKNIESSLGGMNAKESISYKAPPTNKGKLHGIDVVLGSQWGDEGKGKLVDILSQVCKKKEMII